MRQKLNISIEGNMINIIEDKINKGLFRTKVILLNIFKSIFEVTK